MKIITDIETNGIIRPSRIHCAVAIDMDEPKVHSFADQPGMRPLAEYREMLESAEQIVGHNIVSYDMPAVRRLLGATIDRAKLRDTLHAARVLWPDMREEDSTAGLLPSKLFGSHSLAAWGRRLGQHKGDFGATTDWQTWSPAMLEYCVQDCLATWTLYVHILENE